MANFLLNNLFRIAVTALNFVSPSIVADILLHPFDFATVLLQIGFDPEGINFQPAPLFSVIIQYALLTFYIPYLLTTMQGLQLMGLPHPSIFYYVGYIYKKEGIAGCYRGILPKMFERIVMVGVNDRVKKRMNKGSGDDSDDENDNDNDKFFHSLLNTICSQFFAVMISHPFHVVMVSSFAEFTCNRKSSLLELFHSIYADEGYFGFFTGLTARLLGELLSLIFSVSYTAVINTQWSPQRPVLEQCSQQCTQTATHIVNYVTDVSRFTAFKQPRSGEDHLDSTISNREEVEEEREIRIRRNRTQVHLILYNFLRSLTQHSFCPRRTVLTERRPRLPSFFAYVPLTSKLFYYIMVRDFLSKKISTPFLLVCNCAIVLDTGWDKFPLVGYVDPMATLVQKHLLPGRRSRVKRCKMPWVT